MESMKRTRIGLSALAVLVLTAGASAQEPPASVPASPAPMATGDGSGAGTMPDITNSNPAAPLAGANSFTEGQVVDRLRAQGFSNIGTLLKDENGVWRGEADKGGRQVKVGVDYQGNIVTH